jgi:hypothetical protein
VLVGGEADGGVLDGEVPGEGVLWVGVVGVGVLWVGVGDGDVLVGEGVAEGLGEAVG